MQVEYLLEKPFCSWVFYMRLSGHRGWFAMLLLLILPSYCHFPFLFLFLKVKRVWIYWLMLSDALQIITFYLAWAMWALQKRWGKYLSLIKLICVFRCPSREEFPLIETEHKAHLRRLKGEKTVTVISLCLISEPTTSTVLLPLAKVSLTVPESMCFELCNQWDDCCI